MYRYYNYKNNEILSQHKCEYNLYDLCCEYILDKYILTCDNKNLCPSCINNEDTKDNNSNDDIFNYGWNKLCQNCKNIIIKWFHENKFNIRIQYQALVGDYDSEIEEHEIKLPSSSLTSSFITDELLYNNIAFDRNPKGLLDIYIEIC